MRILHLSDLHFGDKFKEKIDRMLPSFLDAIKEINSDQNIDLIVFTGDLVWSGTSIEKFNEVDEKFINPTLNSIALPKNRFILCPGNHDMSDVTELPAITEYVEKIDRNDELNRFIEKGDQQLDLIVPVI